MYTYNDPPSKSSYDAVVIGGGHNGLVAAAYLAKAGLRVLVLERRATLGGAAATEEVFPGYRLNSGANDAGLFLQSIVVDLNLESQGLEFIESPIITLALHPEGRPLPLWRQRDQAIAEIARFSKADALKYPAFLARLADYTRVLEGALTIPPPSLPRYSFGELLPWLRTALNLRRLGDQEMMGFMRLLPMSVAEFLDEWFESPLLKAALGVNGIMGCMQAPRGAGTAYLFLYHALRAGAAVFRASRFVRGGMGELSAALARTAQLHGAEICVGKGVKRVILDEDRATGVMLESGERLVAGIVVSNADPRHTFFELVGPEQLEVRFVREVKNLKFRGSTARVNLALNDMPDFTNLHQMRSSYNIPELLSGHILICPDLEHLERAYDEAKYGRFSQNPCLEIVIPTILDSRLSPAGKHLMSIDVRYAPYHLTDGGWETQGAVLSDRVVGILEAYAPGISETILHQQVLTPLDYEREYCLPEGDGYHGQMGLDQLLFMRPIPGYARYRTPIENLYLCGAGTHPGGGVSGAPGYNAAKAILKR